LGRPHRVAVVVVVVSLFLVRGPKVHFHLRSGERNGVVAIGPYTSSKKDQALVYSGQNLFVLISKEDTAVLFKPQMSLLLARALFVFINKIILADLPC
jgi:hypothetical protein